MLVGLSTDPTDTNSVFTATITMVNGAPVVEWSPKLSAAEEAQQIAKDRGVQGEGLYTRDQIHALEMGNLVLDVDSASGTARVGVRLMESSDLSDPNGWTPVGLSQGNIDIGADGTVGLNVEAKGNAKFFKVVVPSIQY